MWCSKAPRIERTGWSFSKHTSRFDVPEWQGHRSSHSDFNSWFGKKETDNGREKSPHWDDCVDWTEMSGVWRLGGCRNSDNDGADLVWGGHASLPKQSRDLATQDLRLSSNSHPRESSRGGLVCARRSSLGPTIVTRFSHDQHQTSLGDFVTPRTVDELHRCKHWRSA